MIQKTPGASASDLEPGEDGATVFYTAPADLDAVSRALPAQGFTLQSAQLGYRPKNPVTLGDTARGSRGVPESH
jgi:transcriptional/translational regulatory protein YebC/TACO1